MPVNSKANQTSLPRIRALLKGRFGSKSGRQILLGQGTPGVFRLIEPQIALLLIRAVAFQAFFREHGPDPDQL